VLDSWRVVRYSGSFKSIYDSLEIIILLLKKWDYGFGILRYVHTNKIATRQVLAERCPRSGVIILQW